MNNNELRREGEKRRDLRINQAFFYIYIFIQNNYFKKKSTVTVTVNERSRCEKQSNVFTQWKRECNQDLQIGELSKFVLYLSRRTDGEWRAARSTEISDSAKIIFC